MDGAKLTSIDIAHAKAFTAAGHRTATGAYGDRPLPGGPLYGVQHSNGGSFSTIQGGLPIIVNGACVSGIGVSGALPAQDEVSLISDMGLITASCPCRRGFDQPSVDAMNGKYFRLLSWVESMHDSKRCFTQAI
jgi:hypothetical protein